MDDNLTVKDGWGEVFFLLVEAIFLCFIIFIFDLHMYCDDTLIKLEQVFFVLFFFSLSLCSGDGL